MNLISFVFLENHILLLLALKFELLLTMQMTLIHILIQKLIQALNLKDVLH